jgi:hypothetical protein
MNEEYHNHFRTHGSKSAHTFGLESVAFLLLMDSRAVWEERRAELIYYSATRNAQDWSAFTVKPLPEFIVNLAVALCKLQDD